MFAVSLFRKTSSRLATPLQRPTLSVDLFCLPRMPALFGIVIFLSSTYACPVRHRYVQFLVKYFDLDAVDKTNSVLKAVYSKDMVDPLLQYRDSLPSGSVAIEERLVNYLAQVGGLPFLPLQSTCVHTSPL